MWTHKRIYSLLALCFYVALAGTLHAQTINVATYNIRYENDGDKMVGNGWEQRFNVIRQLIRFHDFDIFGAQEVLHHQLTNFQTALPEFNYTGVGRDDGKEKGEYAPIFYKKAKFKINQSGHFWLSEQPGIAAKGWDAVLPRICTWAKFTHIQSRKSFWFFNLHMDHVGVQARINSVALVLSKIKAMCGKDPVILTGDFNVDQTSDSYKKLASSNILFDCFDVAKIRYALNGTINNFNPQQNTESRIDHIFISQSIKALRYGILTDSYRTTDSNATGAKSSNFPKEISLQSSTIRLPSDHYPVMVYIQL